MTKAHAYLAQIKEQEKDVIAVPDGAGRALCVSSDKHWTLSREWDELHIIAPLVEAARWGLAESERDFSGVDWKVMYEAMERERDDWRDKAYSASEGMRKATARAEAAEHYAQAVSDSNRDNADRASKAERERDDLRRQVEDLHKRRRKQTEERAAWTRNRRELISERDAAVARAEQAEASTTPAVTKAEVEKAIRGKVWAANRDPNKAGFHRVHVDWATDAVWSLVSGADPAVFVVRESYLPEAWRDRDGLWRAGQSSYCRVTPEDMRSVIPATLGMVAARESVARAIEAEEEAVDPVEAKARELYRAATPDARWETVADEYRRIAAHVLGQEAGDA